MADDRKTPSAALSALPYFRHVTTSLAPARLDWVAAHAGRRAPRRPGAPFRHLDLGCGYGRSSLLLAAALPEGDFVGLDLVGAHVDDANAWAARAGIANARFLRGSFADALAGRCGDLGRFDYITVHGVLAWIPAAAREELFQLIGETLAPGGLAYLGYNCAAGWAPAGPLQRFVQAFAERAGDGPLPERAAAAFAAARRLHAAGARTLYGNALALHLLQESPRWPAAYLVHEYLAPDWRPLWAPEVMAEADRLGLVRLGSTQLVENRDDFVLRRDQRAFLDEIDDPALAELVRDLCRAPTFRSDVFGRDLPALTRRQATAARLSWTVALTRPAATVAYEVRTDAGTLRFDSAAARAIVAATAERPAILRVVARGAGLAAVDVLNAADALFASEQVEPVDPVRAKTPPAADLLNGLLRETAGTPVETLAQATGVGVARRVSAKSLAFLAAGPQASRRALRAAAARLPTPATAKEAADFAAQERPLWRQLGVT